jgi:hypothetical protein
MVNRVTLMAKAPISDDKTSFSHIIVIPAVSSINQ